MDIDDVFREIGELGRHQKKIFLAVALLNGYIAFHNLNTVFIGAKPAFSCLTADGSVVVNTCDLECKTFEYSHEFTSIATEWHLICGDAYKISLVQSVYMFGVLIGALLFGIISDKYGRFWTVMYTTVGLTIASFLSSFPYNLEMYFALRFMTGFHCGGAILVSFVLLTELVGSSKRALCGMLMQLFFAVGIMVFALFAYFIREWKTLSAVTAAIGTFNSLLIYWFVPESPRWCLIQGKVQQAEKILESIAKKNGAKLTEIKLSPPAKSHEGQKYSMVDLWKHKLLRKRTIIQIYAWFVNSAVYYGLTMSAGSLGSSMYISVALSGAVEWPAYLLTIVLLSRIGRRSILCSYMVLGGLCCIGVMMFPAVYSKTITTLAMMGKLTIAASFAVIYVYSAELFPTVIRNVAMGLTSVAARTGGIMSPLIIALIDIHRTLPYLVYGSLAFTAGLLCIMLPETFGQPMPETFDDILDEDTMKKTDKKGKKLISEDRVKLLQDKVDEHNEFDQVYHV
ncbi:solute carrier family 22 member 15-like [Lineus longissimus]|uniref:solute carrier family 22 member 15-like n=1 Tax=Lineus longissimus TaxID=88925 RepID=UPI002B4D5F22